MKTISDYRKESDRTCLQMSGDQILLSGADPGKNPIRLESVFLLDDDKNYAIRIVQGSEIDVVVHLDQSERNLNRVKWQLRPITRTKITRPD